MTIDPTTMARFLVLPGAAELLEAFATIPPGALRQSAIEHVKVIAMTYTGAPAAMQMPDPLLTAAQAATSNIRIPELPKLARKPKTAEEGVIAARMAGTHAADISRNLSIPRLKVDVILRDARGAGVKFPATKANTAGLQNKTFPTTMDDLDARGAGVMRTAASRRRMSLDAYMAARHRFVELRRLKTPMDEIAAEVKISEDTLWTWLYTARRAGLDLPARLDFDDAEFEPLQPPQQPPEAEVVQLRPASARPKPQAITHIAPGQLVFGTYEDMNGGAQHRLRRAAEARNMTVGAYMQLRESIVRQRMDCISIPDIMARTGQTYNMVKDTMALAVSRGVVFPPTTHSRRPDKSVSHA